MAINFMKIRTGATLKPNTAPGSPENGDMYYDSGTNQFNFYQNGAFIQIGGSSVTSGVRTINAQTGTTYTFALTDGSGNGNSALVTASNAAAQTYTVPLNSSVAFPTGTQIDILQLGAGLVTFAAAGGVTINSLSGGLAMQGQYSAATLIKTGTDTWDLIGTGNSTTLLSLTDFASLSGVTFTNLGTTTNLVVKARRVGDCLEMMGYVQAGTTVASALTLNLPSGYVIDTNKVGTSGSTVPFPGSAYNISNVNFGSSDDILVPFYDGSSATQVFFARGAGTTTLSKANGSIVNSNNAFAWAFTIPIAGWTSTSAGSLTAPRSEVTVDSGNGHGSTNTKVRRFSNIRKNVGAAITYADSSTLGGTFTINETGVYAVSYSDTGSSVPSIGVVVNGTALTTGVNNPLTYAQGLRSLQTAAATNTACAPWTGNLSAGDIVYAQTNGNPNVTDSSCIFTITKVSN